MVENKDLVSVIIPMYNAEKSIEKCVGSIIQQTYTNLEIIIVNDGSVDNSPYIVENFQKNDHRVKLINKKMKGRLQLEIQGWNIAPEIIFILLIVMIM